MKKLSYLFVLITLCIFTQQMQAQPLFVNNNSNTSLYPYDITTYLIYSRTGEVCTGAYWAIPLTFDAGSTLTITDGSYLWNGVCLSNIIGYGCEPVPLDFYGQRIESVEYEDPNITDSFAGMISTIAGVPCLGGQLMLAFPNTNWSAVLTGDYSASINYDNQDPINPISFTSTINYMNWGFMQTLAFN